MNWTELIWNLSTRLSAAWCRHCIMLQWIHTVNRLPLHTTQQAAWEHERTDRLTERQMQRACDREYNTPLTLTVITLSVSFYTGIIFTPAQHDTIIIVATYRTAIAIQRCREESSRCHIQCNETNREPTFLTSAPARFYVRLLACHIWLFAAFAAGSVTGIATFLMPIY